jgi:proteasome accessory factor C
MERDATGARKVNPFHLLFQGGQFYLLGHSHERDALRVFRLSRIRGKVAYATKAEHDFKRPTDFDPRPYANRADWQFGDEIGVGRIHVSDRIAWQIERHFGRFGEIVEPEGSEDGIVFETPYASERQLASWVLRLGGHARVEGPPGLAQFVADRVELLHERHAKPVELARPSRGKRATAQADGETTSAGKRETPIRPERFARLVTLASILIEAGRADVRLDLVDVCDRLQISEAELREDINVLNVVNFGGGSYVLYAEIDEALGEIEVDPEPYSDNFARPARLLPVEAKALVAAIDLIGDHLPEGSLSSARDKIVAALGADPMEQGLQVARTSGDDSAIARTASEAIAQRRLLQIDYYKANEDEFSERVIEPYALINGREGWYVAAFDPARDDVRHFRLDRIRSATVTDTEFEPRPEVDPAADVEGWPRTGEVPASRTARVWVAPERARWAREERQVAQELADGSVIVELSFAGSDWLVREVLKEAGDAVVLEPEDARDAVLAAVEKLRATALAGR